MQPHQHSIPPFTCPQDTRTRPCNPHAPSRPSHRVTVLNGGTFHDGPRILRAFCSFCEITVLGRPAISRNLEKKTPVSSCSVSMTTHSKDNQEQQSGFAGLKNPTLKHFNYNKTLKTTRCCSEDQHATTLRATASCSSKVLCPHRPIAFAKLHATGTQGRAVTVQALQSPSARGHPGVAVTGTCGALGRGGSCDPGITTWGAGGTRPRGKRCLGKAVAPRTPPRRILQRTRHQDSTRSLGPTDPGAGLCSHPA